MSNYIKPQSPLYNENKDIFIYPLTTADQVVMNDGSRLEDNLPEPVNKQITERVIYGNGKNLLPFMNQGDKKDGLTYIFNADGSITINGTSPEVHTVALIGCLLPAGTYIISGAPANSAFYENDMYVQANGQSIARSFTGTTEDTFTLTGETEVGVYCRVASGTINNVTFYPMIRLASETDDTYEPYYEVGLKDAVSKSQVVNNFTTTEEGFVADARALKALVDEYLTLKKITFTIDANYVEGLGNFSFYKLGNSVKASSYLTIVNEIPVWTRFVNANTGLPSSVNGVAVEAFGTKAYTVQATNRGITTCGTKIPAGLYFFIF